MLIFSILALVFLSLVLIKSADGVVMAGRRLARSTGAGTFTVATLLLALSTSVPELFVGVTSALGGSPALSLGNIVGANIANLSLVVGLAGLLGGTVFVKSEKILDRDLVVTLIAGLAPIALLWDRNLSRVDGLILLALYAIYASGLFRERFFEIGRVHAEESFWHKLLREIETGEGEVRREVARFFASVAVLLISANFIVRLSVDLAAQLGIPIFLVGLLLISVGTTLPELVFSYESVRDHAPTLFLGNALGSIVVNSTLILGVVAFISPFQIPARREYLLATLTFILVAILFGLFSRTQRRLARWESGVLFLVYLAFVVLTLSGFKFF